MITPESRYCQVTGETEDTRAPVAPVMTMSAEAAAGDDAATTTTREALALSMEATETPASVTSAALGEPPSRDAPEMVTRVPSCPDAGVMLWTEPSAKNVNERPETVADWADWMVTTPEVGVARGALATT